MLSTMQPLLGITRDDEKKKPALYKFYDFTKGGTDIVDQKIGSYTCKAKSPKWKMVALYYILDTICINATTVQALTEKKDPKKMNSSDVGWELAMSLVVPNILRRNRNGLNASTQRGIETIVGVVPPAQRRLGNGVSFPKIGDKRQRCKSCLSEIVGPDQKKCKDKLPKNKTLCQKCGDACCPSHLVYYCKNHW